MWHAWRGAVGVPAAVRRQAAAVLGAADTGGRQAGGGGIHCHNHPLPAAAGNATSLWQLRQCAVAFSKALEVGAVAGRCCRCRSCCQLLVQVGAEGCRRGIVKHQGARQLQAQLLLQHIAQLHCRQAVQAGGDEGRVWRHVSNACHRLCRCCHSGKHLL